MTGAPPSPTPARRVMRLLWNAARRRAAGRTRRQRELMGRRHKGDTSDPLGSLGRIIAMLGACALHAVMGWTMLQLANQADEFEVRREHRLAIQSFGQSLLKDLVAKQAAIAEQKQQLAKLPRPRMADRTRLIQAEGERDSALERLVVFTAPKGLKRNVTPSHRAEVKSQFFRYGADGFRISDASLERSLAQSHHVPKTIVPMLALMFAWWLAMLVCQGEGLELDVQRRRHPMWEWLLSHPIRPSHAFYAELLTPAMANPFYFTSAIFLWFLFGRLFGLFPGLLAALLCGLPLAVATSALNKALETLTLLRMGARTRGAALGLLSWFGYMAVILPLFLLQVDGLGRLFASAAGWFSPWLPAWPVRALAVGWAGAPSLLQAVVSWWVLSALLFAGALWALHQATARGLQAPSDSQGPASSPLLATTNCFGAHPLYRKELLWLLRDRGAIVQVVLIPLTVGAAQLFNFRGLYRHLTDSWTILCGLAIICGTYFLLVLGPRSLASEGGALWLSLTWPHGLEDLLKAKARLWNRIAGGVVAVVLLVAGCLFPAAWWKILLVGCGWLVFGRTLALKSVSLVTAPSSSGEQEPPNRARQWIAMIGTLSFGAGVMTQTWHVAIIGIVFSSLVAVAMWQGLRARLPYLFDAWSERPVPAPSLIHATVGIALMAEAVGLVAGIAYAAGGHASLWMARALSYGLVGAMSCIFMQIYLSGRDVTLGAIVRWPGAVRRTPLPTALLLGVALGGGLAVLALGYTALLGALPATRELAQEAARLASEHKGDRFWLGLLAVGFAPVAEEYFFRGLLFRTLDRELGDWRATVLSAAFFATFHPPLAWVPVAGLGVATAWLFKSTRHLLPGVICHMTYNAGVLLLT